MLLPLPTVGMRIVKSKHTQLFNQNLAITTIHTHVHTCILTCIGILFPPLRVLVTMYYVPVQTYTHWFSRRRPRYATPVKTVQNTVLPRRQSLHRRLRTPLPCALAIPAHTAATNSAPPPPTHSRVA